jgi:hypothetical protein
MRARLCRETNYERPHEDRIIGTPRSAMTWRECTLCGAREERGQGAFYGMPEPPETVFSQRQEQRIKEMIQEAVRAMNGKAEQR